MRQPGRQRFRAVAATGQQMAAAVRAAGGGMFMAGQWRWGITGPRGTVIINARSTWPHRKLRQKIREATGIALHGDDSGGADGPA